MNKKYQDLTDEEKTLIGKKAVRLSNQDQRDLVASQKDNQATMRNESLNIGVASLENLPTGNYQIPTGNTALGGVALAKDNQATSEETHGTEDVYCCACEYDIACFESKLRELLKAQKDRLKGEIEKMTRVETGGIIGVELSGWNKALEEVLKLLK